MSPGAVTVTSGPVKEAVKEAVAAGKPNEGEKREFPRARLGSWRNVGNAAA